MGVKDENRRRIARKNMRVTARSSIVPANLLRMRVPLGTRPDSMGDGPSILDMQTPSFFNLMCVFLIYSSRSWCDTQIDVDMAHRVAESDSPRFSRGPWTWGHV